MFLHNDPGGFAGQNISFMDMSFQDKTFAFYTYVSTDDLYLIILEDFTTTRY